MRWQQRDLWRPAELTGHYNQRAFQQPRFTQIIQQGAQGSVGRWKKVVLQVRKSVAVSVPGFVVAKIHLNQVHTGFHKATCHQQRPAKGILSVAILHRVISSRHIQRFADLRIDQQ